MSELEMFARKRGLLLVGSAILLFACGVFLVPGGSPAEDKKNDENKNTLKGKEAEELVQLKREVDALETLYHLEPTETQMSSLLTMAERTAAKPKAVSQAVASADYRKTLKELHTALAHDDEEHIDELNEKLAEIGEEEDLEIEEQFDITDSALKAAPGALKLLTPAQVVSYLAARDDEVPDPVDRILATIGEGEEMADEEWKSLRDETAEEVGWLAHGVENDAAKTLTKEASALLDRGHRLKGEALKKEMPTLEKSARKIVGTVSPTVVLQHFMERELAEFLSNPRAVAALKARLAQAKK